MATFDIETTNLSAAFGRVIVACFKPIHSFGAIKGKVVTFRGDDPKYKNKDDLIDDSLLVEAIRDEAKKYNCLITWYGKQFDVPFLNARLLRAGLEPLFPQFHLDMIYKARSTTGGIKIGSSKLINVQKFFKCEEEKDEISWEDWQRAAMYHRKSMDKVVSHCEADVRVTEEVYWHLLPMVKNLTR
jgi:uncharacterized protein YprB with RNaseH-like and TPR domain